MHQPISQNALHSALPPATATQGRVRGGHSQQWQGGWAPRLSSSPHRTLPHSTGQRPKFKTGATAAPGCRLCLYHHKSWLCKPELSACLFQMITNTSVRAQVRPLWSQPEASKLSRLLKDLIQGGGVLWSPSSRADSNDWP